jgi:ribonuclease-3
LEAGLDSAKTICERIVEARLEAFTRMGARDPKSELQERLQAEGEPPPCYDLIESGGPAHERWFRVRVRVGEHPLGEGVGRSKRAAERAAAEAALAGPLAEALGLTSSEERA